MPDLGSAPALLRALHGVLSAGLVRSCHDLAEGGLAVAAAEMAFAGGLGLALDIGPVPVDALVATDTDPAEVDMDSVRLYSESCTRFLLEVAPENLDDLCARLDGFPCFDLGQVTAAPRLVLRSGDTTLADLDIESLRAAHGSAFQG